MGLPVSQQRNRPGTAPAAVDLYRHDRSLVSPCWGRRGKRQTSTEPLPITLHRRRGRPTRKGSKDVGRYSSAMTANRKNSKPVWPCWRDQHQVAGSESACKREQLRLSQHDSQVFVSLFGVCITLSLHKPKISLSYRLLNILPLLTRRHTALAFPLFFSFVLTKPPRFFLLSEL